MDKKPMKCLLGLLCMIGLTARAQSPLPGMELLQQLDSIRHSGSAARHFAGLYYTTTQKAILYAAGRNPEGQDFLRRFEQRFVSFFMDAAKAAGDHDSIPDIWAAYFRSDTIHPVRLQLLGINAHINGDIWQALAAMSNAAELQRNKRVYFAFNRYLKKEFDEFFDSAAASDSRLAVIHELSPGLSRTLGHRLLTRWRKRQFHLARLSFRDPGRFRKMYSRISRKRETLNRLICNHF